MTKKVAIVTDSTAYIPQELIDQYHILVAPQVLIWGEETFEDGVDIQPKEFYLRLQEATKMPSTSQVTPASMEKIFRHLTERGFDILAVLISEKLSGTIPSAVQAKALVPNATVEIVDSNSTSMALGFQVLSAARAAEEGASLKQCKEIATEAGKHTGLFLTVETLEFLHRGGRIGGGTRFLGTALNIKPILELRDGQIEALERIRTRKKALKRLLDLTEQRIDGVKPVRIAAIHANAHQEAKNLLQQAVESLQPVETIIADVSPVVGTHAGPGTVGLAFMAGM